MNISLDKLNTGLFHILARLKLLQNIWKFVDS